MLRWKCSKMPTFLAWHFRLLARPGDDNDELEPEPPGEQRMGTRSNMKSLARLTVCFGIAWHARP